MTAAPASGGVPRSWSAAASAAGPGGIRCLRWCGRSVLNADNTAVVSAVTWVSVRTVAPVPSATRWCTATTTPLPVTIDSTGEPRRCSTVTTDRVSSGGTEYRFPRKAPGPGR